MGKLYLSIIIGETPQRQTNFNLSESRKLNC